MKPTENILSLIHLLSRESARISVEKGITISLLADQKPVCILIHSGIVGLYRRQGRMLMGMMEGPDIAGASSLFPEITPLPGPSIYLLSMSPVIYEVVSIQDVHKRVTEAGLWREMSLHLCYVLSETLVILRQLAGLSAEHLVVQSIRRFALLPIDFREQTRLVDYVQERTQLSRSAIMRTLKHLRDKQDIEINRGFLVKINRLPDEGN
ncbi:helix-turn-helix domain-containing protein [Klebsiella aerogenes]|uniref:helix-turn-helix domain-containing protein n=1 Tax=Klebsiella aerogenes TaxID=548 RepID=UPI0007B35311|nr:helix-turn-helix domain-containing protein [Klebsiella aerogenes]EKZ5856012.1 helix-turn-helix domain-containing protein [Klebsiella aerogenes]EKZ6550424.1 helix-turn-helix domain-containing protein [Klebsiella aerogenes]EKZ6676782.1 helix-turn-helix domain-containing protein [Klebsiella aerogenes]KZR11281.1 hypothetical protein A3N65_12345 [Klebsiella aerogenes]